jgi:hypothetical protein
MNAPVVMGTMTMGLVLHVNSVPLTAKHVVAFKHVYPVQPIELSNQTAIAQRDTFLIIYMLSVCYVNLFAQGALAGRIV